MPQGGEAGEARAADVELVPLAVAPPPRETWMWDLPIRLFHWLLVLLLTFSYVTGKLGGLWLDWHMRSGLAVLALLLFRVLWGFCGSERARFAAFLRGPRAVFRYLRSLRAHEASRYPGHNPAGGWMVVLMLALGTAQAVSGLYTDDLIGASGPLAAGGSESVVSLMTSVHYAAVDLLLVCIALHVAAILFYHFVKRDNLVGSMLAAGPRHAAGIDAMASARRSNLLALGAFVVCAVFVYWLACIFPG